MSSILNYTIPEIIEELNLENGSNYKLKILQKHKDNLLLQRVLKMTYDNVAYNYFIKKIPEYQFKSTIVCIEKALDRLEFIYATREKTGNAAISDFQELLSNMFYKDADIIKKIIGRDLKINLGKTQINKVFKDLITKMPYMRCDIYSNKTAKNIKFSPGACVQLKADGTYRSVTVVNGLVQFNSRSGEKYEYPILEGIFSNMKDGVYIGELLVGDIHNRAESNGLINSDNPPHEKIFIQLWDYVTLNEWTRPKDKTNKKPYSERFFELRTILRDVESVESFHLQVIPFQEVSSISEALEFTSKMMSDGFEGAILKDWYTPFVDGTSKMQLKLKLEIDLEVRLVGFHEGTKGTKREGKIGSLIFQNDEGTIKGRASGFTDKELDDFMERQDELLGKIMTVQFNDLTKAESNDFYALSHPRFISFRDDKTETDTLETAFKLREMAMQLK